MKKTYLCTGRKKYTCEVFAYIEQADKIMFGRIWLYFWSIMFLVAIFLVKNGNIFDQNWLYF